ncbi:hypothetical protein [uncultured Algibacter sp.]|uniref:hypothetical protein n=1 Tax=uncultured Algibacter sp. TaxID=298659 RepID=UPI00262AFDBC|nr:hypothetical protein [uncultured Algibacter sp.]
MKKLINFRNIFYAPAVLIMVLLVGSSCSNEFHDPDSVGNEAPPIITSVVSAESNASVGTGVLNNVYYIKGENLGSLKSIKYNGFESGFNPVFVTENVIISRIPREAPFLNVPNKLTVETAYGIAEFDFTLFTITGFDEQVVDGKNAVILNGGDFSGANKVVFASGSEEEGNLVEREANILDVSVETLTVEVPAGVIQAFIQVHNDGVVATSTSYGFNYPIFTDQSFDWDLAGWSGTQELSSEITIGSTSVKRTSDNWGGFTLRPSDLAPPLRFGDYSTFSLSIYPTNPSGTGIAFIINGYDDADDAWKLKIENLVPNQWNKLNIPITDFLSVLAPSAFTKDEKIFEISIQEYSRSGNGPYVFYFDQIGFIE